MVSADEAEAVVVEIMAGPWVWGRADCCTAACDVFLALHGIDPMAPLRGRYASAREAAMVIALQGGWRAMFGRLGQEAGLRPGAGAPGEIGLVQRAGRHSLAIGLGGGLWAGRIDGGFAMVKGAIQSWRN